MLSIVLSLVLLAAAALKTNELATGPVLGSGFLDSRWLLIVIVEFELLFGLWLLAGIYPEQTWAIALLCFGLFSCVSLFKALSGNASCGCFGSISINPWFTASFDLSVVLALLYWRPWGLVPFAHGPKGALHKRYLSPSPTAILTLWLTVGLPAAYALGTYTDTTLSEAGEIVGNGKTVVLKPEFWVGKRFPLLDYIDIGDQLAHGEWLVLFYHHDCPKCREVIGNLQQISRKMNISQICLLELPPYSSSIDVLGSEELTIINGRLSDAQRWFVQTPVFVSTNEGQLEMMSHEQQMALDDD